MRIDHVIYAVADLPRAVGRFADEFGLRAIGGGEHRDFGTRNGIIPAGAGQYIELMAVAEAGSRHPLVLTLNQMVRDGDRLMAVCRDQITSMPFQILEGEPGARAIGLRRGPDTIVIR